MQRSVLPDNPDGTVEREEPVWLPAKNHTSRTFDTVNVHNICVRYKIPCEMNAFYRPQFKSNCLDHCPGPDEAGDILRVSDILNARRFKAMSMAEIEEQKKEDELYAKVTGKQGEDGELSVLEPQHMYFERCIPGLLALALSLLTSVSLQRFCSSCKGVQGLDEAFTHT